MQYRPNRWENPHSNNPDPDKVYMWTRHDDFEAGADAMLEGLKKEGVYRESVWPFDAPRQKTNGHWCFIPEDNDG